MVAYTSILPLAASTPRWALKPAHSPRRVPGCQPSAQPRLITSAPQTDAECTDDLPVAMGSPVEHPWRWWRALRSCRLPRAPPAELWSLRTVPGEYPIASHQLSHAPSRQRFKLITRSALPIRLSRTVARAVQRYSGRGYRTAATCEENAMDTTPSCSIIETRTTLDGPDTPQADGGT